MARLDDLVAEIRDQQLRRKIEAALADLKRKQRFGLVFEEHVPETTDLVRFPVTAGAIVHRRDDKNGDTAFRVISLNGRGKAVIEPLAGGAQETVAAKNLLVVKRFGEPIYPALTSIGSVSRGGSDRPFHSVINGENFHALQLFVYLFEGKADCIYLDPPYNTGARDWKYNNQYVDSNDTWKHSKWLSFMEKRLRLAKRLLKPDGVLVVTIDEHEIFHLGMLLERVFPEYLRHMVTIVVNPKGTGKLNFARVDEYAIFCVPNIGSSIITGIPIGAARAGSQPAKPLFDIDAATDEQESLWDDEDAEEDEDAEVADEPLGAFPFPAEEIDEWERRHARRRGGESSYRHQRPNQFYPIYVDADKGVVVRAGESLLPVEKKPSFARVNGLKPLWPIDKEGNHRCWRFIPATMQSLIDQKRVVMGKYNEEQDTWTLNIWERRPSAKKLKTVWWETAHDAGTHGTTMLHKLLGRRDAFPFPKSVYAVADALAAVVRNRPDALIIDFFAGSGTTFHATCLLNEQYGGQRRCVLVTNNEVAAATAKKLQANGLFRGDAEYESHGIFEQATRPRCEAVVTGKRADGRRIDGAYIDGKAISLGFAENVEFFRIDYLDPDEVDLRTQFDAILPALWLAAGATGDREESASRKDFSLPKGGCYGVLFRESKFRQFKEALAKRPDVSHVWLVTDSEEAYAEMRSTLPRRIKTSMLYRDYLRNFRINTRHSL